MAAAVAEMSSLSDDAWLVQSAKRRAASGDPWAAKAWLLTAKTLYPRSFAIQYEAYCMEKNNRNTKEVAKLLEEMMMNFPQEQQLWKEVQSLSEALQSDATDTKTQFMKDLFGALPGNLQCHMLAQIAEMTSDVLQQCRLVLLVLRRYPERIPDQGFKLIDSLLNAEKRNQVDSPVNCYRKYLVCDLLPVVLASPLEHISHKLLYRWLQKAIEFFTCYVTQPPSQEAHILSPTTPDLTSPTKKVFGLVRRLSISGLSEKDSHLSEPWTHLYTIFRHVAQHLGWKPSIAPQNAISVEAQWQAVEQLQEEAQKQSEPTHHHKHLLYATTVLFFCSLSNYATKVDPEQFAASGGHTTPFVLIEGMKSDSCRDHRPKKLKSDKLPPKIVASKNLQGSADVILNFNTAMKCWQLLHSPLLEKDFGKLCQHWRIENWVWLKYFSVDVAVYQGQYKAAINSLQELQDTSLPSSKIRCDLQIASCYFLFGSLSKACESLLSVVGALPQGVSPIPQPEITAGSSRQLNLLCCSEAEILPYCIHLLITCCKEKAFRPGMQDDVALGHLIVLLQYDWPRYEQQFLEVVHRIKQQGSFTYSQFFNYIILVDMLEEIAFIKTPEGGKVNLDIKPTGVKASTQRTVTRGVNKGAKENFRVSMEKQMARSQESVDSVLRQFLVQERDSLQKCLS